MLIVASPIRWKTNRTWKGYGYVTWHFLHFWGPIHISGMAKARAIKFCTKGDYTVSGKKWNHYYLRHNLDKQKYIVVIFAQNIATVMRNQTNTTKAAAPNQSRDFTLWIKRSSLYVNAQCRIWQVQENQTGISACNCLINGTKVINFFQQICWVSNFCSEILSKNISQCTAFLVSITLLNAYVLVKTALWKTSHLCHHYVVLCK